MEEKITKIPLFSFKTLEEFDSFVKEQSRKVIDSHIRVWETSLKNAQSHKDSIRDVAFTDNLSIEKYNSTLVFADKLLGAFKNYLTESLELVLLDVQLNISSVSIDNIDKIDKRLKVYFNLRKEFLINAIPTLEQYKIIIKNTLSKLLNNKTSIINEQIGFDLGLDEDKLRVCLNFEKGYRLLKL